MYARLAGLARLETAAAHSIVIGVDTITDVEIIVVDPPRRLVQALVRAAKQQKTSVNEIAARILADHYGVEREQRKGRFVPITSGQRMLFSVPVDVRQKLREQAAVNGATMRGLVIATLAAQLGLPTQSTTRRPRR